MTLILSHRPPWPAYQMEIRRQHAVCFSVNVLPRQANGLEENDSPKRRRRSNARWETIKAVGCLREGQLVVYPQLFYRLIPQGLQIAPQVLEFLIGEAEKDVANGRQLS